MIRYEEVGFGIVCIIAVLWIVLLSIPHKKHHDREDDMYHGE